MSDSDQLLLFDDSEQGPRAASASPEGLKYAPEIVDDAEQQVLVRSIAELDLKPFEFHGFFGNRRTASFGWRYDYSGGGFQRTESVPDFLLAAREKASVFAGVAPEELEHVLVTEYAPGAGIGWHRDRPQFGIVVALSLLAPCRLRFRRRTETSWERVSITPAPRSVYLLAGSARETWQHSIPPVDALRYSITFRTFRSRAFSGEVDTGSPPENATNQ